MPIYEYECEDCGHHHEALQKISDPLLRNCPSCGKDALKKMVSAASFRLSGSGWYETDFKSDNKKNLAKSDSQKDSDSKETKKADKKDSGKKNAKSDSKKDTKSSKSAN